jgi:hypothetical protein
MHDEYFQMQAVFVRQAEEANEIPNSTLYLPAAANWTAPGAETASSTSLKAEV